MVKTLLKHEAKAYLHTLVPMNIILVAVALFTRILWIFESKATIFRIVGGSSIFALCVAMIVSIIMSTVFSITRFYKNLFTSEGYLTMTLPVTPAQHLLTKLICAVSFNLLTLVGVVVAASVAMAGDMFIEVVRAGFFLIGKYFENLGFEGGVWAFEFIIAFIVSIISQFMLYYTCISIGQLARKNRILAAFGVYFAYYFICQTLATIGVVIVVLMQNTYLFEFFVDFINDFPDATTHIFLIGMSVYNGLLAALYYFISHRILSRKLNLE